MKDVELWSRLQAFSFPLTSDLGSLQAHLANKTTLGPEKAVRAISEYRRFLYLAATSGEVVAPSPLIDRVWHTHIEDTRAYLGEFAGKVIGRVLHHSPGRVSAAKDPAYRRTLELYEREFGEVPFAKVWPSPELLQSEKLRTVLFVTSLVALALSSSALHLAAFLGAILVVPSVGLYLHMRWGYWTVTAASDGSGCSSCGGGDGGGCGGE